MHDLSRGNQENITFNENIINCKDVKWQLFFIYQSVYWGIMLILNYLQLNVESGLKNRIIIFLSCISLIFILIESVDIIKKAKYKWSGTLILLFASTLAILFNHI